MKKIAILILFLCLSNIYAQDHKYYFFNPQNNFGSDKLFNPLSLLVNGSYDILRNGGHTKNIFDNPYAAGFKNVTSNLLHPVNNIKAYGWKTFWEQEVFNLEFNNNKANFVPNFVDHTLGNGMQYAKLKEWFDYNHYPYPGLLSFTVTTAYQYMNEVLENGNTMGPNIDPISDMYIYNLLGIGLFEIDGVKSFLSETFPMYEWSLQPMFNFNNHYLENAGQQYIIRKELPYINNVSGFVYWGQTAIFGLTYRYNNVHNFSIGVGQIIDKINENFSGGLRFFSPHIDGALSVFYDKNNSLLFSAILTGPRIPNLRINVYPGLFNIGDFEPGIYLGTGKWDNFIVGINLTHYFPISPAFGRAIH